MAHGSKHDESSSRCVKRIARGASDGVALPADRMLPIGFFSFEEDDSEEKVLRSALEKNGDCAWRRLELQSGAHGVMPPASDIAALGPGAVIVVLSTAERAVVEPLFARLRLDDPQRPILVAPRGLSTDGISELLSHGASDFLLLPYLAACRV